MSGLTETATLLRNDSLKILNEWDLLNFLSKFGKAYIVGSVELDLMTWRDIDIEVISGSIPEKSEIMEIATYLFGKAGVRKVSPIDYSDGDGVRKPKGLYVGAEYVDKEAHKWKIDVWLLSEDSARTKDVTESIKQKLTPEFKENILAIKSQLSNHPKYRKEITSMDIYAAVIDGKVTNLEGFKNYTGSKGIEF